MGCAVKRVTQLHRKLFLARPWEYHVSASSPSKIVTWFGRNALVTRVVCFSRSSKETRTWLQKGFCDENNGASSETREYFVLVPSGYSFAISGSIWLRERVCDFVIMFTVNVENSFQSMF